MATNEKKEKSLLKYIFILVTLILIVLLARLAWARYVSTLNGQANANIAQFNFRLIGDSVYESEEIIFAITRDDGNTKVADNTIAPGTSGKFTIGIDSKRNTNFFGVQNKCMYEKQT